MRPLPKLEGVDKGKDGWALPVSLQSAIGRQGSTVQGFGDITPLPNSVFWEFERVHLNSQRGTGDHRMILKPANLCAQLYL